MTDNGDEIDDISYATVQELADAIQQCRGHYSFLIGAGSSAHDIPTAGQLIDRWQKEKYNSVSPNQDLNDWVDQKEPKAVQKNNKQYGYWFEERHKSVGERRHFIENIVEDASPNFGHIVLASMMSGLNGESEDNNYREGYVPVTLTPNFDDLLYDAFYLFLEDKPLMVDHNVLASQFQLTRNRPTIIKLHGDYLYNNIQNTENETANLEENIEKALSLVLQEYGMVVLGYSGADNSIMSVFEDDEFEVPDYGIYWCTRNPEDLSDRVKNILQKKNTFVVEIDGSKSFFKELYEFLSKNDGFSVPDPDKVESRALTRANKLREAVEEGGPDTLELKYEADSLRLEGEYDEAIEGYKEVLEHNPDDINVHESLGDAYSSLERHEEAIEAFSKAIHHRPSDCELINKRGMEYDKIQEFEKSIDDYTRAIAINEKSEFYNNRGTAKIKNGEYEAGLEDLNRAIKLDSENAYAYVNRGFAKSWIGEYDNSIEDLDTGLEINPDLSIGRNSRAAVELAAGNIDIAKKDIKYLINTGQDNARTHNTLGVAYSIEEQYDKAIKEYKKAIENESGEILYHQHIAETYILSGRYEEALDKVKEAQSLEKSDDEVAVNLLLEIAGKTMLDRDTDSLAEEFRRLCEKEFEAKFRLRLMREWIDSTDLGGEKEEKISSLIELLEPHLEEMTFYAVGEEN